jgi:hypothetical protein
MLAVLSTGNGASSWATAAISSSRVAMSNSTKADFDAVARGESTSAAGHPCDPRWLSPWPGG